MSLAFVAATVPSVVAFKTSHTVDVAFDAARPDRALASAVAQTPKGSALVGLLSGPSTTRMATTSSAA